MITRIIKNQWYLLQLENYHLKRFFRLVARGLFWKIKDQRKPLVYTHKLKLIIFLSLTLQALLAWLLSFSLVSFVLWFLALFLAHFIFLFLSVLLTSPLDFVLKRRLINLARKKINSLRRLMIVAITGSFGKTTMKESLQTVLSQKYKTLSTPENINTPVGISRFVLSQLDQNTEVFIVEMGAYKRGDIAQLCAIAKPDIAVLTGINESHLERFGSLSNTVAAKFEIIDTLKADGVAVLNGQNLLIRENYQIHVRGQKVFFYQVDPSAAFDEENLEMNFTLQIDNKTQKFSVKNLGTYISGVASACAIIGKELGLTEEQIAAGISKFGPVNHRLNPIVNQQTGILVIDDSYNGNPDGVREALALLSKFRKRRKIYITPGLIEMGPQSAEIHYQIGLQLGKVADLVILIKNSVTPKIAEGLRAVNFESSKIIWFNSAQAAHAQLPKILQSGDVILFQNDWPENYV